MEFPFHLDILNASHSGGHPERRAGVISTKAALRPRGEISLGTDAVLQADDMIFRI